jgi:branched-chain amino acid transport system ATP-binding protein
MTLMVTQVTAAMATGLRQKRTLRVEALMVRFGGITALSDVSLEVRPGEIVGIIGPNGAGKTTLFNSICGFVKPTSGAIRYGAETLTSGRPQRLARLGIARTLQGLGLWEGLTALENVMTGATSSARAGFAASFLALPRADRDEARLRNHAVALLEELGVAGVADRMPPSLPYGVQKRIALARALAAEPSLLLLDEPAGGLSGGDIEDLATRLRGLRSTMAIALVEHHMDFVMTLCDRVVVLDFGRLIASGRPQDVRTDPLVTAAYLGEEVEEAGNARG